MEKLPYRPVHIVLIIALSFMAGAIGGAAYDVIAASIGITRSTGTAPDKAHKTWETAYSLTPQLTARTKVSGSNKATVKVTLLSGAVVMGEVNLIQSSPVALLKNELVLGDAKISAGTKFTMTIPTTLQKGQLLMEGDFQSASNPQASISAVIASWELKKTAAFIATDQ